MKRLASISAWAHGLGAAVIGGAASAGSTWLTMAAAKASGVDVPALNLKALGIIMLTSGILNALLYLKQSPLPSEEEEVTVTTTTTETKTPV